MASNAKSLAELIAADSTIDVANTDITGVITETQIADSAVTPGKLSQTFLTPTGDGSGLTGVAGGFSNMQVFTSPGQFNAPPSANKVKVTVVGGGGGGGCVSTGTCCFAMEGTECRKIPLGPGSPGGGSGTAIKVMPITAGSPYAVTVGTGGISNAAGGTSSFAGPITVSATGGGGGNSNQAGTGSGGDLNFSGVTCSPGTSGSNLFYGTLVNKPCTPVAFACAISGGLTVCRVCACTSPAAVAGYGSGGVRSYVSCGAWVCTGPSVSLAGGCGTPGIVIVEY